MDEEAIRKGIARYRWYQPISFGRGIWAHAEGRLLRNREFGALFASARLHIFIRTLAELLGTDDCPPRSSR